MKKILILSLLLPTFTMAITANAASPSHQTAVVKAQKVSTPSKSKSTQAKVYQHHEKHWKQPEYGSHTKLFRCTDSWGHRLRGKFSDEQQYFIELGGGSCRIIKRHGKHAALAPFKHYNFPMRDVYAAINTIKRNYRLSNAQVIEADNIKDGYKTFKYTLIFKDRRHGLREFKIKHNKRNGEIRDIKEV